MAIWRERRRSCQVVSEVIPFSVTQCYPSESARPAHHHHMASAAGAAATHPQTPTTKRHRIRVHNATLHYTRTQTHTANTCVECLVEGGRSGGLARRRWRRRRGRGCRESVKCYDRFSSHCPISTNSFLAGSFRGAAYTDTRGEREPSAPLGDTCHPL